MSYLLKVIVSSLIIVGANSLIKWSPKAASSLIALPIMSLIYLCFMYYDFKDSQLVANASWDIFKIVIPSLAFFPILSFAITKFNLEVPLALLLASAISIGIYLIQRQLGLG
jgi:hypothetical protein